METSGCTTDRVVSEILQFAQVSIPKDFERVVMYRMHIYRRKTCL